MSKKVLLSGVKPTGRPHIGNYFGAMKQFVDLQNTGGYESFIMIADLHALTTVQNAAELQENTIGILLDYMAIGLDPKQVTLFKQSDVPAHTELAWIFECLVSVPFLMRGHAFKAEVDKVFAKYSNDKKIYSPDQYLEKRAKEDPSYDNQVEIMFSGISAGLLNYPMLMAADILLYDADIVPVGRDQRQHVEYARDVAQKFNAKFGDNFKLPNEKIVEDLSTLSGIIIGTDGRKMSKSYANTIPLFATDEEIEKLVMSIITDSNADIPENVLGIHYPVRVVLEGEIGQNKKPKTANYFNSIRVQYKGQYKKLKELLIEDLKAFIKPMRERRQALEEDKAAVLEVLKAGGKVAYDRAERKMEEVRKVVGLKLY